MKNETLLTHALDLTLEALAGVESETGSIDKYITVGDLALAVFALKKSDSKAESLQYFI